MNGSQMDKPSSSKGMTIGLALLGGFAFAALRDSGEDFILGAILGALFAQILHLRGRVHALQTLLADARRSEPSKAAREVQPAATPTPPFATEGASRSAPPPSAIAAQASPTPQSVERREGAYQSGEAPRPAPRASTPSVGERAFAGFMAWIKRGNPLARIGIVILFFGAAFLANYAAENDLFPIELRFIALALGAFALLFIGWRLREKRAVYAQLLQGGGVAGLYLTVFAALKLYSLLPIGLAFALMVLIALASAVLAVAQNALVLAVIATAGGFLAPLLVSTGGGNHIALFSYYAVLNLGVFAIAWFRTWRVLNVLGFVFTFTITGLWRVSGYEPDELVSADAFLIVFFLMYVGVSVLNSVRQPPDLKGYVSGSLVFGLPVVAFSLHASLVSRIEYAMAWSALALGAFYLALAWTLFRTRRESFRLLIEAFAALGVIFASLAIPLAFEGRTTAAMWAVEGAGLLWLGVRQQRKLARAFGALLQLGAGVAYLLMLPIAGAEAPFANRAFLGALLLGVSGVFSSYWLHRNDAQRASYEEGAQHVFLFWGVAWWLFAGLNEIAQFLRDALIGASLTFVAGTAALLAIIASRWRWRGPELLGAYLSPVSAVVALTYAAALPHPFAEWGALGWAALLIAHLWILRAREQALPGQNVLHAFNVWLIALIAAWEASHQIDARTTGVWASLPWGVAPALLIAWFSRRTLQPAWPVRAHAEAYRVLGAGPLVAVAAVWIAITNLTSRGDASWLPYVPLLNPLDVASALCFAAGALWWTSLTPQQRSSLWKSDLRVLIAIVAALGFVWLNAALLRALHHNFGAPITAYGMAHSTLVQSSLSIFWGLLGFTAMTVAAKQRWRYVWLVGGGLMLVVVAKLFLVDLSNVATIARIASFLSVGALLLITGYLAPLPPRRELNEAKS